MHDSGLETLLKGAYADADLVAAVEIQRVKPFGNVSAAAWDFHRFVLDVHVLQTFKGDAERKETPIGVQGSVLKALWPSYAVTREVRKSDLRTIVLFASERKGPVGPTRRFDVSVPCPGCTQEVGFIEDSPEVETLLREIGVGCLGRVLAQHSGRNLNGDRGDEFTRSEDACESAAQKALKNGLLSQATGFREVNITRNLPNSGGSLCALEYPEPVPLNSTIVIDSELACAPVMIRWKFAREKRPHVQRPTAPTHSAIWLDDDHLAVLEDYEMDDAKFYYVVDMRSGEMSLERTSLVPQSLACIGGWLQASNAEGKSERIDRHCQAAVSSTTARTTDVP